MSDTAPKVSSTWIMRLFTIAGLIGLVAGLWAALAPDYPAGVLELSEGPIAARVNGVPITMLEFERAAQAVQNDRRNVLGPEEAERVLQTLINEELLAQEAVRLALPRTDREVRAAAVRGVMRLILSDLAAVVPSDDELTQFYGDHPDLFAPPVRLHVRHLEVPADMPEIVDAITASLGAGAGFGEVLQNFPNASSRPLPDRLIRAEDMRQYLGGPLSEIALSAEQGTVLGPIELGAQAHFLWVIAMERGSRPHLAEVREAVEDEWRRRAEEDAVTDYLERLRARSAIEVEAFGGR